MNRGHHQLLLLVAFASLMAGGVLRAQEEEAGPTLPSVVAESPAEESVEAAVEQRSDVPVKPPAKRRQRVADVTENSQKQTYDEDEAVPLPSEDGKKSSAKAGESVPSLLPDPTTLIPRFEPQAGVSAVDTGVTPERWLDQNYQFLNEGEPFFPGRDPYRERPGLPVGWFGGVDLNVIHPEIDSQVNNSNLGPGDAFHGTFTNGTRLPVGDMNWTVMPKVSVGYRRENGLGEIIASYRFIQSNSSGTLQNFDTAGAGQLHTRSTAQAFDLVYAFSDRTDGLPWILPTLRRYSVGLRVASWVFDTTANGQQVLEERAGNVFVGGGPVLIYEGTWLTPWESVTFDAGFDAAGVGGFNYQRFAETAQVGGGLSSARGRTDGTGTATPILGVWGGISWAPDWNNRPFKFSAGYRFERWINLTDSGGQNDLTLQGPFVRADFRF